MKIDNSEFVNISVLDILEKYDVPHIFTFLTSRKNLYLAYFIDHNENDNITKWLYFLTNQFQINELVKDKITIREFMSNSELVHLAFANSEEIIIDKWNINILNDIDQNLLPENNVYLESDLALIIKIEQEGLTPRTISTENIFKTGQKVISSFKRIMKTIKNNEPSYFNMKVEPELVFCGINEGSVEISLKQKSYNPMLQKAIQSIVQVLANQAEALNDNVRKTTEQEIINLCPATTRKNYNYDSISIISSITNKENNSILLKQNDYKTYKEKYYPKNFDQIEYSIVLSGFVEEYDRKDDSFTLRKIEKNDFNITETKCNPKEDSWEDELIFKALDAFQEQKKIQVMGKFNKETSEFIAYSIEMLKS